MRLTVILLVLVSSIADAQTQSAPNRRGPAVSAPQRGNWRLSRSKSAFDDTPTVIASLAATGTISGWPKKVYRPSLIVGCDEGDLEAYVNTGMTAQPEQNGGAAFRIRWDSEAPTSRYLTEASSNDAYFFEEAPNRIAEMLVHKRLLLGFTPFNSAPVTVTFDIQGLTGVLDEILAACPREADSVRFASKVWRKPTPGEIASLTQLLKTDKRWEVVECLRGMGPNSAPVVPGLLGLLRDEKATDDAKFIKLVELFEQIGPAAGPEARAAFEDIAKAGSWNMTYALRAIAAIDVKN